MIFFMPFYIFAAVASATGSGRCHFVVTFASKGAGTDGKRLEQVRNYLLANDSLVTSRERKWGKEGEVNFCVHVESHADLYSVRGHLERIVSQGPTSGDVPRGAVFLCLPPKKGIPPAHPDCVSVR